jgi:hypothetical protein
VTVVGLVYAVKVLTDALNASGLTILGSSTHDTSEVLLHSFFALSPVTQSLILDWSKPYFSITHTFLADVLQNSAELLPFRYII